MEDCAFDLILYDPCWHVRGESSEGKNANVAGAMGGFANLFVFFEDGDRETLLGGGDGCACSAYPTSNDRYIS
jgi:hypothetical protein